MKLNINLEGLAVPVSPRLINLVKHHVAEHEYRTGLYGFAINFRDTSYSVNTGGYHPVEIGFSLNGNIWSIDYLTDFALVGGPFPELAKEVDFNLLENTLFTAFGMPCPLDSPDAQDFYQLWESNFLGYVDMDCYDQIKVTLYD